MKSIVRSIRFPIEVYKEIEDGMGDVTFNERVVTLCSVPIYRSNNVEALPKAGGLCGNIVEPIRKFIPGISNIKGYAVGEEVLIPDGKGWKKSIVPELDADGNILEA